MQERRIPEWLRHAPTPTVRNFGILSGIEAIVRGILISVFPLVMYRALGDAGLVSQAYFLVGLGSLIIGLLMPGIIRLIPRRWAYTIGVLLFVTSAGFAIEGSARSTVIALALNTVGTVMVFICFNAYVLDYISRVELGKCETSRMFYSAVGWTVGPMAGVLSYQYWAPAPFVISGTAALVMLAVFWFMRLGNGKLITRARGPASNPLVFLPRFLEQPRLVTGYVFALVRSCGWWVYVVYLPIFAIENGLGDQLGGILLSITNAALFGAPLLQRWISRRSIRQAVQAGFGAVALCFSLAAVLSNMPVVAVALLVLGSFCMIELDICAGLPFLMAVKPSERTEMSAIYSSYRDVSGILTPGAAWLVLLATPLAGIFAAGGFAAFGAAVLARRLHPRLGRNRMHPVAVSKPESIPAQ
ncbi:MFS transporter [Aliisedimentitalea scapharcae]|uniref:MFS transporter n=1 Tax=Aliisedimentitalea scapharcae TaxID=1524259 RepID=A0ABZ2XXI1_9RHOB|nr:MFS transporter [Rhodobacteraceae bacterium M382]